MYVPYIDRSPVAARTAPPTVRALLGRPDLELRIIAPGRADRLDAPVRWVHSTDLVDPTPFLSDGMVLLTTGTQFGDAAEPVYRAYVDRLVHRGVVGLGFGTEVVREGVPPGLVRAAERAGLPLFEVPYRVPFIAVARANAEAIAAEAFARRTWALAAQRAISLAALRPDGLGATVAELSRQLETWIGLFDAGGSLTREHPHGSVSSDLTARISDEVTAMIRRGASTASVEVAGERIALQALGPVGAARGALAITGGELDREGRDVLTAVIAMAGLALEQQRSLSRARRLLRTGVLQFLLAGERGRALSAATELWGDLPQAPLRVAVLDAGPGTDGLVEWLEVRVGDQRGAVFFGFDRDDLVLVTEAADADTIRMLTHRFHGPVGLSLPVGDEDLADGLAQARSARERAGDGVHTFDAIADRGMREALRSPDARAIAGARLAPLVDHDARERTDLVRTVRTWLTHDARIDEAARALGVHRHTVRARVAHAGTLLGTDLSTFSARADLWSALLATDP